MGSKRRVALLAVAVRAQEAEKPLVGKYIHSFIQEKCFDSEMGSKEKGHTSCNRMSIANIPYNVKIQKMSMFEANLICRENAERDEEK